MSDRNPEKKKSTSRGAVAAPATSGSQNSEEASSTIAQEDQQRSTSPPPDYKTFAENVTFTLNRVMEALSTISDRLEALEQRKASPTPSVSEHPDRKPSADEQEGSEASKPSYTGLAERMFERKIKSSAARQKRYSTLEDLISTRQDTRRRLHFDEESEEEVEGPTSQSRLDQPARTKTKKPGKIFRELQSSTETSAVHPVMIMRKEKECNITIERFQLSKVAKAIRDILDFQEEEETTVRIQKVLSRKLKEHLRLIYNITHADLAKMDMADLFQIIARETRVYSTVAFYNELKDSLAHDGDFKELIGYSPGTYPEVSDVNDHSFLSDETPTMDPVSTLFLHCSLISQGGFSDPDDILYVFTAGNAPLGTTIEKVPPKDNYARIRDGTYQSFTLEIKDQDYRRVKIRDPAMVIELTFRQPLEV